MNPMGLAIQAFVKEDTLRVLLDSLLRCEGLEAIDVVFFTDGVVNSRHPDEYAMKLFSVEQRIQEFIDNQSHNFRSVRMSGSSLNLGPCRTCQVLMDQCFRINDFCVLLEDDLVLSADTFLWFDWARNSEVFKRPDIWAVAGESIYFDSRGNHIPREVKVGIRNYAIHNELSRFFTEENFIPSSCFGTSAEKWRQFSMTRGDVRGDVEVCRRCRDENKICIFPVVPRVKDDGMLHDDGFSVLLHSKEGVSEIKSTYLLAEELGEAPTIFVPYGGNRNELYQLTTGGMLS